MNTAEAIKAVNAGEKVRGKTWWHGRYVYLASYGKTIYEDGSPADMSRLGDNWELYKEAPRLEQFGCAVYTNGRGTYFSAPILTNGEIDHNQWTEVTDPAPGFLEAAKAVL